MDEQELERQLMSALEKHSNSTFSAMSNVIKSIPEKTTQLNFEIFPAQDGGGFFFSIRANLDGPDLYVLNKAINSVADIFTPKYVQSEIEPYIPTVDPFILNMRPIN